MNDGRVLTCELLLNPLKTSREMCSNWQQHGILCSDRTVRRRLHQVGCKSVTPRKVPHLTPRMKRQRLVFARQHQHWTVEDSRNVCFSDESMFCCQMVNKNTTWKLPNHPHPSVPTVKHPTKVMFWVISDQYPQSQSSSCGGGHNE